MTRAFVVVNPAAGGGRTGWLWPGLRDRLHRLGLEFEAAETSGRGAATDLTREAVRVGWPLVVAVGGDGTVNEVINGLTDADGRSLATLGVVLTGRGRDVGRSLGLSTDPETALRRLVAGEEVLVDLGAVEWEGGPLRHMVNTAGAGFDAVVARRVQSAGGSGTLPYLLGILGALRRHRPVAASIQLDDRPIWAGSMTAAVVANGPYYGGGMQIAPAADPDDGDLDLVIVGDLGRAELLAWLPTLYRGTHLRHARVTTARGRAVRIATDPPVPVHLDGEAVAATPVRIGVRRRALRLRR